MCVSVRVVHGLWDVCFGLCAPIREAVWAMIMGSVPVSVVWQTDGVTPLYAASDNGHVEVVRALVGAGAAVNQADVCDDWGCCLYSVMRGLLVVRLQRFCVAWRACV